MSVTLSGDKEIRRELSRLESIKFDKIVTKNLTQMYNRGLGNTPVDTGELRESLSYQGNQVGYSKYYAPFVELGHTTRGGGFVNGQFFLQANVKAQETILRKDIIDAMEGK